MKKTKTNQKKKRTIKMTKAARKSKSSSHIMAYEDSEDKAIHFKILGKL